METPVITPGQVQEDIERAGKLAEIFSPLGFHLEAETLRVCVALASAKNGDLSADNLCDAYMKATGMIREIVRGVYRRGPKSGKLIKASFRAVNEVSTPLEARFRTVFDSLDAS